MLQVIDYLLSFREKIKVFVLLFYTCKTYIKILLKFWWISEKIFTLKLSSVVGEKFNFTCILSETEKFKRRKESFIEDFKLFYSMKLTFKDRYLGHVLTQSDSCGNETHLDRYFSSLDRFRQVVFFLYGSIVKP